MTWNEFPAPLLIEMQGLIITTATLLRIKIEFETFKPW